MNNRTRHSFFRDYNFLKKLVSLTLAFIILIQPILPVFAQEVANIESAGEQQVAPSTESATEQAQTINTNPVVVDDEEGPGISTSTITPEGDPEDAADNVGDGPIKENDLNTETMSSLAGVGEPTTSQPVGAAVVKQTIPDTDPSTGALVYSYPITVPPGRNSMTPDLKLTYNSQDDREGMYFGDKWSINIPYIERINKTGTDRLYTDSYFSSSLDGELVLVSGTTYAPKVENGNFLKYTYDGTSWTVTDKSGTVYKFGDQAASRQDNPSDSTKVYRWMLAESRDTNNNFISYSYYKDAGQIYPDTILYTGYNTTNGIFKVVFNREAYDTSINPFSPILYSTNFKVVTNYRINNITISVNNEWVRKYDIGYSTGDQGYRALLSSVTETGRDVDSNTTAALPAATFTYKTHDTMGWDTGTTWQVPRWLRDGADSTFAQIQDINGDTYPDFAYYDTGINVNPQAVHISNTIDGWLSDDSNWTLPIAFKNTTGFKDNGLRLFDVNGDLLNDLVRSINTQTGDTTPVSTSVYLNSGDPATGWVQNTTIAPPIGFVFNTSLYADDGVRMIDVNGDGLIDMVRAYLDDDGNGLFQSVYLSNGSGWTAAPSGTWEVPFPFIDENPDGSEVYTFAQIGDLNGDKLPDIYWRYSQNSYWWPNSTTTANYAFINNGHGWEADDWNYGTWTIPIATEAHQYIAQARTDNGIRSTDLNGDGIIDLLRSAFNSSGVIDSIGYLNSRRPSNSPYNTHNPANTTQAFATNSKATNGAVQLVDVNADGLDDFVYGEKIGSTSYQSTELAKSNSFTDLLTGVTLPTGGSYAVTYKLSNKYRNGDDSLMNPKLPLVIPTVQQIVTTEPVTSTTGTITYTYKDGLYYYNSPTDRKFAGFNLITKTDAAGNVTKTYYHQGNASDSTNGEYSDDVSKIGKPYRIEQYDNAGNLYQLTVQKWDKTNLGTGRDFVKLATTTILTYNGDTTHKDTAQEYTYDSYGNVTQKTDWGQVTASTDGTFTDTGSDKSTEAISYVANTTNYVVGLPYQNTVTNQSSSKVRESKTYYDTLSLGSVGNGNPTKVEQWVTGTTYINSQKAYNSYGLVSSSTDPRSKTTSYSYDTYNLYPTTVTDPLTHTVQYTYDYSSGKVKQLTDNNSFVYQTTYDGLDRTLTEKIPEFTSPYSTVTKITYAYTDTSSAFKIQRTDYLDGSNGIETHQYLDGFGRLLQERKEAESGYNVRDFAYNNINLLLKESLPYSSSGSSKTSPTSTTALYTSYTYDPVARIATTVDANGTTSYTYDDWKTTVTDKNSKVKSYYADARNNLIKVDEVNGSSTYTTNYEWNLNGKLTKITDAASNIRNFTYDGLGRRLTAEDLHTSSDTTYGTWSYTYDDAGNITQTISPRSLTTNYTYNDVNQVLTEDYTGGTGTEISYTYSGCTNGTGKLCSVSMTSGANTSYTYDSNGNIASEVKTINATAYTTSYTYDRQANIATLTYPDSSDVKYTYNVGGLLEKVERRESGGAYSDVISDFDYNPVNKITNQAAGNGTVTTNTYDAAHLYRLTTKETSTTLYIPPTNQAPSITLTGADRIEVTVGGSWTEPGYTATDTEDGTITSNVTVTGSVNTAVAGTYQLVYSVSDIYGIPATAKIRTVVVKTTPSSPSMHVKALVVGGGGGGGKGAQAQSGGGGSGGHVENSSVSISPTAYTITVGAGGAGATGSSYGNGSAGGSSSALGITAAGGGYGAGGSSTAVNGGAGASGGGASGGSSANGSGGAGSQGNNGGAGFANSNNAKRAGGGGGGASTAGSNGAQNVGGNGGDGIASSITGTSVTRAGGGGGASSTTGGTGGAGGGGNGSNLSTSGTPGTANTGSGGGGGSLGGTGYDGQSGGSGIVIIAYKTDGTDGVSTSSTGGTTTTSGSYKIHSFTSSGTFTAVAWGTSIPIITLTGTDRYNLTVGDSWSEPGYSASDVDDGLLTSSVTTSGSVNTSVAGTYQLVYSVANSNGIPAARKIRTVVVSPVGSTPIYLQDLAYSYDNENNITQVVDSSETESVKTATYVYDDIYRLTSATITGVASGQSTYTHNFSYDSIGNITSGPIGTYTYAGTSYANPHAATSINSVTYSYDNDGNITGNGTLSNTWNYKDQLTQAVVGSVTSTYAYDHQENRVSLANGTTTTVYPNKFYNTNGTKKTKQIYAGDQIVSTVETVSTTVTPYYVHTDHLLGSNVITDNSGTKAQLLDYFPYGDIRINQQSGSFNEQRKYIGQLYDADTGLDYLNARYYKANIGRFMSQDPMFWVLANESLLNPQNLNSYSYANNNPVTLSDPNGKCVWDGCAGEMVALASVAIRFAPQISSFLQSLINPIGQYALSESIKDAQNGNYGWAAIGAITAGEVSGGKTIVSGIETTSEVASFLNKGSSATDVYLGVDKGKDVYVGISKNAATREAQHGERFSDGLTKVTNLPTRNQARAIEQVIKDNKGAAYQNIRNSISPSNPLFKDIKEWGAKMIKQLKINKTK